MAAFAAMEEKTSQAGDDRAGGFGLFWFGHAENGGGNDGKTETWEEEKVTQGFNLSRGKFDGGESHAFELSLKREDGKTVSASAVLGIPSWMNGARSGHWLRSVPAPGPLW